MYLLLVYMPLRQTSALFRHPSKTFEMLITMAGGSPTQAYRKNISPSMWSTIHPSPQFWNRILTPALPEVIKRQHARGGHQQPFPWVPALPTGLPLHSLPLDVHAALNKGLTTAALQLTHSIYSVVATFCVSLWSLAPFTLHCIPRMVVFSRGG
jgi:hypothetical protein